MRWYRWYNSNCLVSNLWVDAANCDVQKDKWIRWNILMNWKSFRILFSSAMKSKAADASSVVGLVLVDGHKLGAVIFQIQSTVVSGNMHLRHRIWRTTSYNTNVTHAYHIWHRRKPTTSLRRHTSHCMYDWQEQSKNLRYSGSKPKISYVLMKS